MCGFAGFLGFGNLDTGSVTRVAIGMGEAIAHRGPDDSGVWQDSLVQVALVHRRLSILDVTPAGHQPMVSASGRYVIAFNGEIYNHLEIRKELQDRCIAPNWRGHSDTETLLAGIDAWGLEETLSRSIGMFALALWDKKERALYLTRDRLGEKPLYYGWQRGVFLFGSELKALKAHPSFGGEIDRDAITLFLRHNYIPAPYSIYQHVKKLPPAYILKLRNPGAMQEVTLHPYWSLVDVVTQGQSRAFTGTDTEAVAELDDLLRNAVAAQMVADVPLGAFLSGGVDSSTIVALMQAQSTRSVRTFTIGFNEDLYNEADHAKAIARHLGTEHTELYMTPRQTIDVIPRLPTLYDEPFSDPSQIPTFLLSNMTRQYVTVSLSGDAGDELFGGYSRYTRSADFWKWFGKIPNGVRKNTAKAFRPLSMQFRDLLSASSGQVFSPRLRNIGDNVSKFAKLIGQTDQTGFYKHFITHWPAPPEVVLDANEPENYFSRGKSKPEAMDYFESMMLADSLTYLPDDILVKVDRAAMGVSLETRVPFLDHRVVEFAWRLPLSMKIRKKQGKWILREVLYKYVPRNLIERPKMGFGVPIDSWLRGPLRDWADSLLNESRLRQEGIFNPAPIRQKWSEHLAGHHDWQYHLWDVLMFQSWLDSDKNKSS
ncbi:MAG: asparagine synthase (glutamine-hydrolyzing) [Bacteroidia bacterium]|nr:asparagine synthase (glutamine-hydrolyzing) [Bacteroidia bacterium]